MSNFKLFLEQVDILEATFQDIENELNKNSYSKFTELPTNKIIKPRMLMQIYIALLILGINTEDIQNNPRIMLTPEVKNGIQQLMTKSQFHKDFGDLTTTFSDDTFRNIESDDIKNIIKQLTNKYGEHFDIKLMVR